jgi:predicted Zn-dependent protease
MGRELAIPALLMGLQMLAACATTSLPPAGAEGRRFLPEEDEQRWWNRAREVEQKLDEGGYRYEDAELENYLTSVAFRMLLPEAGAQGFTWRVKVLKNPLLNAFALPHGVIYIHTGMLARMENEAQLAALLGHELTHSVHRHAIQQFRRVQNLTAVVATLSAGLGPFGGLGGALGSLGALAAVSGYSREFEREADEEGLKRLVKAGYDPRRAPELFELLQKDPDGERVKEPFFFGTHPRLRERVENYTTLLKTVYKTEAAAGGATNQETFLSITQRLLLDNAILDLRIGRYGTAKLSIDKLLKRAPQYAPAHYYLGEIYRQRGKPEDRQEGIRAYRQAAAHDPSFALPHRGLGLMFLQMGMGASARSHFERYLALAPEAKDRAYIEGYLDALAKEGVRE